MEPVAALVEACQGCNINSNSNNSKNSNPARLRASLLSVAPSPAVGGGDGILCRNGRPWLWRASILPPIRGFHTPH